jgi:hypothetical protein
MFAAIRRASSFAECFAAEASRQQPAFIIA